MGATHKGELSASIAILGLLSQEPDTAARLGQRLTRSFPPARFARSVVHNTLPSLKRRGLVCVLDAGTESGLDRYALTPRGSNTLQRWLHGPPTGPPVLRDPLHAKIVFAGPQELPTLIGAVRKEEQLCAQEYAAAHARLLAARPLGVRSGEDWKDALERIMTGDEVAMWLLRVRRLQRLHQALQELERDVVGGSLERVGEDASLAGVAITPSPLREQAS
jgi:DNA-binding PadR family transcriptional regulator